MCAYLIHSGSQQDVVAINIHYQLQLDRDVFSRRSRNKPKNSQTVTNSLSLSVGAKPACRHQEGPTLMIQSVPNKGI